MTWNATYHCASLGKFGEFQLLAFLPLIRFIFNLILFKARGSLVLQPKWVSLFQSTPVAVAKYPSSRLVYLMCFPGMDRHGRRPTGLLFLLGCHLWLLCCNQQEWPASSSCLNIAGTSHDSFCHPWSLSSHDCMTLCLLPCQVSYKNCVLHLQSTTVHTGTSDPVNP